MSNVCQDRPRRCFSTCCSPGPSLACTATPSPRPPNLQSRSRSRRRNQQGCLGSAATSSKTLSASTSSRSTRTIPTQTGFWAVRFSEARAIQASGVRRAKCCCSHPLPEGGSWTATGTSPRPETDGCFFFHRECGRTPARSWQPSTRASTRSVGEHHPGSTSAPGGSVLRRWPNQTTPRPSNQTHPVIAIPVPAGAGAPHDGGRRSRVSGIRVPSVEPEAERPENAQDPVRTLLLPGRVPSALPLASRTGGCPFGRSDQPVGLLSVVPSMRMVWQR